MLIFSFYYSSPVINSVYGRLSIHHSKRKKREPTLALLDFNHNLFQSSISSTNNAPFVNNLILFPTHISSFYKPDIKYCYWASVTYIFTCTNNNPNTIIVICLLIFMCVDYLNKITNFYIFSFFNSHNKYLLSS